MHCHQMPGHSVQPMVMQGLPVQGQGMAQHQRCDPAASSSAWCRLVWPAQWHQPNHHSSSSASQPRLASLSLLQVRELCIFSKP